MRVKRALSGCVRSHWPFHYAQERPKAQYDRTPRESSAEGGVRRCRAGVPCSASCAARDRSRHQGGGTRQDRYGVARGPRSRSPRAAVRHSKPSMRKHGSRERRRVSKHGRAGYVQCPRSTMCGALGRMAAACRVDQRIACDSKRIAHLAASVTPYDLTESTWSSTQKDAAKRARRRRAVAARNR